MEFDPESQNLKCPFCSDTAPIEKSTEPVSVHDYRTADTSASHNWGEEKRLIKCEGCGAETMIDSAKSADFCAFCGSSHIINQEDTNPAIAPETVIPFKISKNQATEAFKQWIAKKKFAPNALKSRHTMESISGVYMPFWSYNSKTESDYTAEKGTYYYTSETKTFTIDGTEVSWQKMNHPGSSYAYSFIDKGCKFIYATDTELRQEDLSASCPDVPFFRGADVLILDAQYTVEEAFEKENWGHSSFNRTIDFSVARDVKNLYLFHHDPTYSDRKIESILSSARWYLDYIGKTSKMNVYIASEGKNIEI